MCYTAATPGGGVLKEKFNKKEVSYQLPTNYYISGFERPYLPVTLNHSINTIQEARWKLIPSWINTEQEAHQYANTLNAESESIFTKSSYKDNILYQRGLLYVSGFYEPHHVHGKKDNDPYFIYDKNENIFTLGIIYNTFQPLSGKAYDTFSIITTKANDLLSKIHNVKQRMPLVIPIELREPWLLSTDKKEIENMMVPYIGELKAHRVQKIIGSKKANSPDVQKPIPEGPQPGEPLILWNE